MVNIFLVGFMGAGKSVVGKLLAKNMAAHYFDLDEQISEDFGCSIPEVFEDSGEAVFRAAETDLLKRLCAKKNLVVATGGGAFSDDGNRRMIEESGGVSVFLDVPWPVLQRRLERDNCERPVYHNAEQARSLYAERLPFYRLATVSVALTGGETPQEAAESIANAVRGAPCGT